MAGKSYLERSLAFIDGNLLDSEDRAVEHLLGQRDNEAIFVMCGRPIANPGHTLDIRSESGISGNFRQETVNPKPPKSLVLGLLEPAARDEFQSSPELFITQDLVPFAHHIAKPF
jgi:hypothetical protein